MGRPKREGLGLFIEDRLKNLITELCFILVVIRNKYASKNTDLKPNIAYYFN